VFPSPGDTPIAEADDTAPSVTDDGALAAANDCKPNCTKVLWAASRAVRHDSEMD